jgi:hypothetical protein
MSSSLLEQYDHALAGLDARIALVGDDQWSSPTPCRDWDVRALVAHLVNEVHWVPYLLDGGSPDDRSAVDVGRNRRVAHLCERSDLAGLEQSADPAQVGLQDGRRSRLEHTCELERRRQPFARRDRNRRRAGDVRHRLGRLGRCGLLEPERIEGLESTGEADRARRRELPVCADEQVAARADRLPHGTDVPLSSVERVERGLPRIERRVRSCRIELDRCEPLLHVCDRALRRQRRVGVDVGGVAVLRIEIGVRPQPLADLAAEQRVHGPVELFADDVPARHLDSADAAGLPRVAAELLDLPEETIHVAGVLAQEAALQEGDVTEITIPEIGTLRNIAKRVN